MTSEPSRHAPGQSVDLTNCDREPIHQLGRVQSYGALLALSSDWIVQHASENLESILGIAAEDAIGAPLRGLIVSDGYERIRQNMRLLDEPGGAIRLFNVAMRANGRAFDVSVHGSGNLLIVEFEPKSGPRGRDVMSDVYPQISALKRDGDLAALAMAAARGLQELSGFDSVMVYQFQPDQSGKVIAERRKDSQSVYDGLMFPASDIPAQARKLYTRSLLRLIADVDDPGSAISPGTTLDGEPLDLSLAVTRAVSPIHIEYLKNMGVGASMSVSIMKDGELWGLFACHNHTPLYIDYERRTAFEMFAHMFSYELSRFEDELRKRAVEDTSRLQTRLMGYMADGRPMAESLLSVSEDIGSVIAHDGLVLYEDETFHATGLAPTEEEFRAIAQFLDRSIGEEVYATDRLEKVFPRARDFGGRAAGILAIPISKRPRDYLVFVRRQIEETVSWAGDPRKPVTAGPNGERLTPRKSFEVWRETVSGRSIPWAPQEMHSAERLRMILLEVFLKMTDAANDERERNQQQQQLLISELNHRVRNILNLMRGLLAQSRASTSTLEEFTANLDGRIQALGRAHDQLTAEQYEPASLTSLIECEFEAYADHKMDRVIIDGPEVFVNSKAFTTMALVLHEMATNSIKYGALCDKSGRVEVKVAEDSSGGVLIDWLERGGPPVTPPKRRGFGSMIIEGSIPHELRGDAKVCYKMTGLEAHFRLPPTAISSIRYQAEGEAAAAATQEPAAVVEADGSLGLKGQGLVLEDTLIIAMDAAGILEDLGASDVKITSSVTAAMTWLDDNNVDFAVLDVNLGDEQSLPVAERLYKAGVPIILATGYGEIEELAQTYPPCGVVQKPFSASSLETALKKAISKVPTKEG
ncbi:MAG: hybrid sensor histidine kinase/response regulator [Rhodobacteraceae bacterium]|jgi:light-regulated signal transduction histidine kinase (bacteriophytochrome)|uniref:HWE histidine kinase domain-containing protein n=1 Tax=Salipiger TaxID=263377 RepID=UPI0008EF0191|nr:MULTISPECIES: HWE histidine kinase domain-containing protein [Salipiger]MAB05503.1 hybrid sensor histidine kinase/response regulator [Paracoccaceae bacterium]GGA15777.1 signal transduction histidine kinase [Salipiger profundus]SFD09254.1 Bacteriophytochrome (light-regulated signal transduction histidine kinase) [Salipiger profundus]